MNVELENYTSLRIIYRVVRGNGMKVDLFHSLEGENIYFKPLSVSDAQEIHSYASDENVSRFIGWNLMHTLNETLEYIEEMIRRDSKGTHLYASVVLKSTKEIIGTAMMFNFNRKANHAEIGYVFHRNHWSKGYGTEAVALMSDFAFESINLHKIHARVIDANIGSIKVLEKNEFKLEGRLKDYNYIEGTYYDELLFGKLKA